MLKLINGWIDRLRESAFVFPLAVLAGGLMVIISELGYHQASSQLTDVALLAQTRRELLMVLRCMAEAESSQRGYLLTHRPEYLAPYREAIQNVQRGMDALQLLYERRADKQRERPMVGLSQLLKSKLSEMDRVITLFDAGYLDSAMQTAMIATGHEEMNQLRVLADDMVALENQSLTTRQGYMSDTLSLNRLGVAAMTAISLLMLGLYLRQHRQSDALRREQQQLIRDERDRLEIEVLERTTELTELTRHLETAREDERARLARDLHDELGALLTAAKLDVARFRPHLQRSAPELLPRVNHLVETLNSGIALKRSIIENLRPSSLDNLGLGPALEILCAEFAERLGVPVATDFVPVALTPSASLTAFRLVQEALNNIAKHAQARSVTVTISASDGRACVSVSDDGAGFTPVKGSHGRHGLMGMRYRVEADQGTLDVRSSPGQGTRVQALLPLLPTLQAALPTTL